MFAIILLADPEAWSEPNGLEGLEFENGEGRQLGQGLLHWESAVNPSCKSTS
jgi:hypothetical protein